MLHEQYLIDLHFVFFFAPEGESSSESEFSDDEVLNMLRQKARSYREQLKLVIIMN